jgi:hypothetical protein
VQVLTGAQNGAMGPTTDDAKLQLVLSAVSDAARLKRVDAELSRHAQVLSAFAASGHPVLSASLHSLLRNIATCVERGTPAVVKNCFVIVQVRLMFSDST